MEKQLRVVGQPAGQYRGKQSPHQTLRNSPFNCLNNIDLLDSVQYSQTVGRCGTVGYNSSEYVISGTWLSAHFSSVGAALSAGTVIKQYYFSFEHY